MQIFISWAQERSKQIGEAFSEFLPLLMEEVEPFFSPEDIAKGSRWLPDLSQKLETISMGILCITPESTDSHWLMFEAGALSKSVTSTRVFPVLFGIESSDLPSPLAQFQSSIFRKEEIFKMVQEINRSCSAPRSDPTLLKAFDLAWPGFEQNITEIMTINSSKKIQKVKDTEKISEILDLVRLIQRENITSRITPKIMNKTQAELVSNMAVLMMKLDKFSNLDESQNLVIYHGLRSLYQVTSKAGFPKTTSALDLLAEKFRVDE